MNEFPVPAKHRLENQNNKINKQSIQSEGCVTVGCQRSGFPEKHPSPVESQFHDLKDKQQN